METLTATNLRKHLFHVLKRIEDYHTPIRVQTKNKGIVLVSEEEWNAIQETLYLSSQKTTFEEIKEGMATPLDACEAIEW